MNTPILQALCVLLIIAPSAGCADEAEREHLAALRGDENGSTTEERMAHFDRAIELAPDRIGYRVSRAVAFIDQRAFPEAEADLDAVLELGNPPYSRFLRGLVLCQQDRFEESLADFDAAIEAQPENTQFYRGRGLARAASGRLDAAMEDAEHLVRSAPHLAESYYVRARVLAGFRRFGDAVGDLDRAIEIRPDLIYTRQLRANCLRELGELDSVTEKELARLMRQSAHAAYTDPFRY